MTLLAEQLDIRKASVKNPQAWSSLRIKLWPSLSIAESIAEMSEFDGMDFLAWIASFEGNDIGFIEISVRAFANGCRERPVVFIEGIWIDKRYRHCGVGRALICVAQTWAINNGFNEIASDTDLDNTVSQKAHLAWGFKETERVVYFCKDLSDKYP